MFRFRVGIGGNNKNARVSLKCTEKIFTRSAKLLEDTKNCIAEYVGSELSLKRRENKNILKLQRNITRREWSAIKSFMNPQIKIVDTQIDRLV